MSIKPLDMQVMIPKLQEVAQMKQLEHQKAGLNQQSIGAQFEKKNEKANVTVNRPEEEKGLHNQADAKEKGKNEYYSKNKKRENNEKEKQEIKLRKNRIDIKI